MKQIFSYDFKKTRLSRSQLGIYSISFGLSRLKHRIVARARALLCRHKGEHHNLSHIDFHFKMEGSAYLGEGILMSSYGLKSYTAEQTKEQWREKVRVRCSGTVPFARTFAAEITLTVLNDLSSDGMSIYLRD